MSNEIKEIKIKTIGQLLDYVETEQKAKELIDYITNLQEENEKLLKKSYSDDVRITKAIEYLKKYANGTFDENLLNILQ